MKRRTALRIGSIGVLGLGGCINSVDRYVEPPPFGPLETNWTMRGFNAGNTGFNTDATGPIRNPTIEWEIRPSASVSPTIALKDELLVVAGDQSMYGFDLERREQRWSVNVDQLSHPTVDDELCYVNSSPKRLFAHERSDGSVRWRVTAEGELSHPVLHDGTIYVTDTTGQLRAIEGTTGEVRWNVSFGEGTNLEKQITTDGTHVVVTTNDELVVRNASDGSEQWRSDPLPMGLPAPIFIDETIYTIHHSLIAWDITNFGRIWEFDPPSARDLPIVDKNQIYVGLHSLHAYDRETTEENWVEGGSNRILEGRCVGADGTIFMPQGLRGGGDITAVNASDGQVRWNKSLSAGVYYLAVAGEWLFAGMGDGRLYGLKGSGDG